jgi:class 3 adenylate cyclase
MTERSRILVVDDHLENVEYLEQELADFGYATERALSGLEALEKVHQHPPDLILLDLRMPGMDGFTVCRMLKSDEQTRLIPIVVITALDGLADRIKAIELGADDVLTKPINDRQLIARIQTSLKLKHAIDRKLDDALRTTNALARFVPDPVKRVVAANPDGMLEKRERDVSVMLLDVSGYSRLSETIPTRALNELIERYFSSFLDILQGAGADINETAGDSFMAIFGDQDPVTHAVKAAGAALEMLATTRRLNESNDLAPLAMHVGINSGRAFVGPTRFASAGGTRETFTATGQVTNLAARLAGVAEDGEIIVGPETARRISEGFRLVALGERALKNLRDPVSIHRLVDRIPPRGQRG